MGGGSAKSATEPVPLLDLQAQYRSIRAEVRSALDRVIESQRFILGPEVSGLEEEVAGWLSGAGDGGGGDEGRGPVRAVGCASGTDALLLPLLALASSTGLERGDVVVPAFTFFATAGAVWNAGFRPVFCDVDPETFNVTRSSLEAAWTDRTVAVVPVHLFGQMAPMEDVTALARERGAFVLEDAAQAIGARRDGRVAGTVGECGALSFFPTKNLGGFGDGGMILTRDDDLAGRLRKLRVHGGPRMYHHELVGTNSRLDALQAAVLRVKLRHVERWTEARRENAGLYAERLADVDEVRCPVTDAGNVHTYNQYTLRVEDRDGLRSYLEERGIGTGLYYPIPLHLQECFSELGYREGDLPTSEGLCGRVLSLPVFPELGEARLERVAEAIRAYYGA